MICWRVNQRHAGQHHQLDCNQMETRHYYRHISFPRRENRISPLYTKTQHALKGSLRCVSRVRHDGSLLAARPAAIFLHFFYFFCFCFFCFILYRGYYFLSLSVSLALSLRNAEERRERNWVWEKQQGKVSILGQSCWQKIMEAGSLWGDGWMDGWMDGCLHHHHRVRRPPAVFCESYFPFPLT